MTLACNSGRRSFLNLTPSTGLGLAAKLPSGKGRTCVLRKYAELVTKTSGDSFQDLQCLVCMHS